MLKLARPVNRLNFSFTSLTAYFIFGYVTIIHEIFEIIPIFSTFLLLISGRDIAHLNYFSTFLLIK